MNNDEQSPTETLIREELGTAPAANFSQWNNDNKDALRDLQMPRDTPAAPMARCFLWQVSAAAVFAIVLIGSITWWGASQKPLFAKTVDAINLARTITWVRFDYRRGTSKDGERFWLRKLRTQCTYVEPGFYRYDRYDKDGALESTTISDPVKKQGLTIYHQRSLFELADLQTYSDPQLEKKQSVKENEQAGKLKLTAGPFGWLARALREGGKVVGQRSVDGRKVDVLRFHNLAMGKHNPKNVTDIWIDAETQQMVGASHPGSSVFAPEELDYRDNPPEERFSSMKILGNIVRDIVLDSEVDPSIFDFDIPAGFERAKPRKPPATITEQELVEWLKVMADVNDGQFVDGVLVRNTLKIGQAMSKEVEQKSEAELRMGKIWYRHMMQDNTAPLWDFIERNTIEKDFRYLGRGVKLGASEKVILIYRPKMTGKFRAVYGDLRIEDLTDAEARALSDE